jgi:hypothetical protein
MKKQKLIVILAMTALMVLIVPVIVTAQSANSSKPKITLYSVGSYNDGTKDVACYWKDGIRQTLDVSGISDARASGIAVSGSTVYVVGSYKNGNNKNNICYWKDGVRQTLDHQGIDVSYNDYYGAIAVSGTSVYIAGEYFRPGDGNTTYLCYWKDGIRTDLDRSGLRMPYIHSIAVSGSSVYVTSSSHHIRGYRDTYLSSELYWKNGVRKILVQENKTSLLMTISGTNVYFAGLLSNNVASYMKEDEGIWRPIDLEGIRAIPYAIVASGSSFYTAGVGSDDNGYYWVNGIRHLLNIPESNFDDNYSIRAIAVTGSSVYVAGLKKINSNERVLCYWENGELHNIGTIVGGSLHKTIIILE